MRTVLSLRPIAKKGITTVVSRTPRRTLTVFPKRRPTATTTTSTATTSTAHGDSLFWSLTLFSRVLAGCGLVHVLSEYGIELTKCEGPSMMPTILPTGDEIILFERWTHRLWGLDGGDGGALRCLRAREKQAHFEQTTGRQCWHDTRPWLLTEPTTPLSKWVNLWHRLGTGISVGDVVVLQHPQREGTICKRVLGLPGDMVIPSQPLHSARTSRHDFSIWNENQDDSYNQDHTSSSLIIVPDGHIWVEGDNSNNSSDSRHYGAVPAALVMGKVLIRIWPLRGQALIVRGPRPAQASGIPFSGSTILPAGYEGEDMK
jgi:signal peptidase I